MHSILQQAQGVVLIAGDDEIDRTVAVEIRGGETNGSCPSLVGCRRAEAPRTVIQL